MLETFPPDAIKSGKESGPAGMSKTGQAWVLGWLLPAPRRSPGEFIAWVRIKSLTIDPRKATSLFLKCLCECSILISERQSRPIFKKAMKISLLLKAWTYKAIWISHDCARTAVFPPRNQMLTKDRKDWYWKTFSTWGWILLIMSLESRFWFLYFTDKETGTLLYSVVIGVNFEIIYNFDIDIYLYSEVIEKSSLKFPNSYFAVGCCWFLLM